MTVGYPDPAGCLSAFCYAVNRGLSSCLGLDKGAWIGTGIEHHETWSLQSSRGGTIGSKVIYIVALVVFAGIALAPIAVMFVGSFIAEGSPSLSNYSGILQDGRQLRLLLNSLTISVGAALCSLAVGVPMGFLIKRTDIPFRRYLRFLFLAPLIIPPYMSSIAWIHLMGTNGVLNVFIMNLFHLGKPAFTVYGLGGAVFVLTLSYFPFATLLTIAGLESLDGRLEEAAALSHRASRVLRKITLPLISPHVWSAGIFVFIFSISNYSVPDLLRVNAYPIEIFIQFSAYYDEARATALSIPLVIILFLLVGLQRRCMGGRSYVTIRGGPRTTGLSDLGRWTPLALGFVALVLALSVGVPFADLVITSGSPGTYVTAIGTAHTQIVNSLVFAASAATATIILAFVVSYMIERSGPKAKSGLDLTSFVPFAIPAVVLGIGLTRTWNRPATAFIYGTPLILVMAYTARFIPFVIRPIASSLKQIGPRLEEAAWLAEPRWSRRVLRIVLPLARPGVVAGWAIAFALAMGELATTLLVTPPGEVTLPLRIYTLMHYGAHRLVASLCVILVLVTLLPIVLVLSIVGLTKPRRETA